MRIEKAAEAIVEKSHEHCATWITIEEARELARAALPHLMEEPTDVEIDEIAVTTGTQGQLRSVSRAIYEFVRRRNAPPEPPAAKQDINSEEWVKAAYPNANCLYGEKTDTHFVLSDKLLILGSGESEGEAWANADSRLKSLPSIPQAAPPEPPKVRTAATIAAILLRRLDTHTFIVDQVAEEIIEAMAIPAAPPEPNPRREDNYRPTIFHLSNSEVHATGTLCGGAVANIARELLELRAKVPFSALDSLKENNRPSA